ncbi:hypothetical protein B0J13DRAFT_546416 [Dactylonectria estremocensis]|uniref:Zn(2)-C6 fungal-type domain-containing protein n=1 Tax=Dactylonectria estremocensis TaxID=1079267 RepID=A0A9P9F8B4_9HYPO|nr:hypothetical protein B0J13DRAFT_546416 [Dactylonectria estremocensis]
MLTWSPGPPRPFAYKRSAIAQEQMADTEFDEGDAGQVLNPIACSHCRQRKRKCDRQLPHCLQCSHDPSNCHYPEQNKRGIPIGFINRLEARLLETEDALFRVLQSVGQHPVDETSPLHHSRQSKADRIKEWDNLPLQSIEDINNWYQQRNGASPSSAGDSLIDNPPPQLSTAWPPRAPSQITVPVPAPAPITEMPEVVAHTNELLKSVQPASASNGASMLEESWEVTPQLSDSKAKDLGLKHPDLYF